MKSFEELKQQDQVDAEEALKLSMEEHLKATGNVHKLKASEIGSTLPQWNANKILGNPVRFVSDKDGNTLQYNEKEQCFDLKPTPKLEILGEGDVKVSKVGEKVVVKSDISKSDTVVGLKHAISTKAPSVHEHKDYVLKGDLNSKLLKLSEDKSSKNHSHNNYVTFPVIEKLKGELDKSLEIGLSKKAEKNHKHDLKIPTFKKEFGKIEKDINTLQEVVGVVGDKSNLVTKADLKIAVSEVVSLPVKKHDHTDYVKVVEIDKLKKTITELKIVDKKGNNNKAISDLLAYKAERNHAHSVSEIQGLGSTLSGLGSTYLKVDGSNYMIAPLGINTAPRAGSVLDIISSDTGSIASVTSGSITFNYTGGGYYNEGLSYQFDVYAYRTFGVTKVYSATAYAITGTDNSASNGYYNISLAWGEVIGADGYRVVVTSDSYAGASGDRYFDIGGNSATVGVIDIAYVSELSDYYASGTPALTPTTTPAGSDFYLDTVGDLHSTGDFYFGNYPSLSLGTSNGLQLTGSHAKTLSFPTTSIVKLGGLSLAQSYTAGANQLIFPQGAGGSLAPGIRFQGGQTDGGLAMNDGILEFWNNFSEYCSPVSGHLQGIFRFDTRSGYESEGFIIGGKKPDGTGFSSIGINYNTGDVNLTYYGHGSVAVGIDVGSAGISGNGHFGVKYDIYAGRNVIVNSTDGMKIGTATTQKLGFFNATPVVQPSAYTVTNPSTDRAFDVSSTSVNELASVLGTLIGDLKSLGLIG